MFSEPSGTLSESGRNLFDPCLPTNGLEPSSSTACGKNEIKFASAMCKFQIFDRPLITASKGSQFSLLDFHLDS